MNPIIEEGSERYLVGYAANISLEKNETASLWQRLMPLRDKIKNRFGTDYFAIQNYDAGHDFRNFDATTSFEMCAAIEVDSPSELEFGMQIFIIPAGLYAVYTHKGLASDFQASYQIFRQWLVLSDYMVDFRPHFQVMGAKYKNGDPSSEEDVWIPIKKKMADG